MSSEYGVTPSGFVKKQLPEILAEIETAEQLAFGEGIILNPAEPLGLLNGIMADALSQLQEQAEAIYNAYDVTAATGAQLDRLAAIRNIGLVRLEGETDAAFAQRIGNNGVGNIKTREAYNELLAVPGVTWVNIAENATAETDASGLPPHSVSYSVIGGADADVAQAIYNTSAAGIGLVGNSTTQLSVDGLCRRITFNRPEPVLLDIEIDVSVNLDRCNCAPSDTALLAETIAARLSSVCALYNGMYLDSRTVELATAGIGSIIVECIRFGRNGGTVSVVPIQFGNEELPTVLPENITVSFVAAGTGCATVSNGDFPLGVLLEN